MVTRLTESPVVVRFVGGPCAGESKEYPRDPVAIGRAHDAAAKGMSGLYRTTKFDGGVLLAEWVDHMARKG